MAFSPRAHPTNKRQLWAKCTHPSRQTGGRSRWPSRTMGGAKSRMTKWSLRVLLAQKSVRISSLRLNSPRRLPVFVQEHATFTWRTKGDELVDYERGVLQRTNAPVNPSRSQLEAFRRPPSMTFVCLFHGTTRTMKKQQPAAQTHRFTRHTVFMSKSIP